MIELKSRRSARSTHYQVSDTEFVCHSWSRDKFYYNHNLRGDGEGGWRRVDDSITETQDGWEIQFSPLMVNIPRYADDALVFSNVRSDGTQHNDHTLVSHVAAAHVEGVLSGNDVVYADAFGEGSDLIYRAVGHTVARYVRVRAGATPQPEYRITFRAAFVEHMLRGINEQYEVDTRGPKVTDSESLTKLVISGQSSYLLPFLAFTDKIGSASTMSVVIDRKSDTEFDVVKTVPEWWDGVDDLYMDDSQSVYPDHDGDVYYTNANWATCRASALGTAATTALAYMYSAAQKSGALYYILRCFVQFTNTVPAGAQSIDSATLAMYSYGTTGSGDSAALYEWTNSGTVTTASYDDFNTTQLATEQTWPATNALCTWTLNASGLALVPKGGSTRLCVRDYTHDALNSAPVDADNIAWKTMDTTGTASDPLFAIGYTMPAAGIMNLSLLGVG